MSDPASPASRPRAKNLTAEQVRAIAEAIAAAERPTAIAERFGVSVETVRAIKGGKRGAAAIDDDLRARMLAAPTTPALDATQVRAIAHELEAGRTGRAIAEEFGISPSMVSAIKHGRAWSSLEPDLPARLADKPQQGKALTAERVARIKRLQLEGVSSRKIAAEFGVSASTVLAIARGATWAEVEPSGPDAE